MSKVILTIIGESFLAASAFVANNTVSQTTTLNFQLFLNTQTVQNNDYLMIILPNGVSFKSGTAACSITQISVSQCLILSGTQARINLTLPKVSSSIQGSISNFINPDSVRTINNLEMNLYSSTGTIKASTSSISLSNFQAAVCLAQVSSSSNQVGNTNAQLKITITPQTVLKANGFIAITIPQYYTNSGSSYMFGSSPSCSATISGSNVVVSSCTFTQSLLQLQISYTFTSGSDTTQSLQLSVTSFQNPISTQPKSGFQVLTQDSSGNQVEQSNTLTLSGITQPAQFQSFSLSLLDSQTVQSFTGIQFKLSLQVPLEQNCYLKFVFPSDFTINASMLQTVSGSGFINPGSSDGSINLVQEDAANGILVFQACQVQYGPYQTGIVTFSKIQNPEQVKTTGAFQILLAKDQAFTMMIAQVSSSNNLVAQASLFTQGAITQISITPVDSNVVQTATNYSISFTTQSSLPKTGTVIIIQFPSQITLSKTGCQITGSSSNFNSGTIACSIQSGTVTITNPFSSVIPAGSSLQLKISYGINPQSQLVAGSYSISTYVQISGTNYIVDSGSFTSLNKPVGGLITQQQAIQVNNQITFDNDQTYSFYLTLAHSITSKGYLLITIPSEISISSSSFVQNTCTRIDNGATLSCNVVSSTQIQVNFNNNGFLNSNPLQLKFSGIKNPRTTKSTSVFEFKSFDSNMILIDSSQASSNITAYVTQPSNLISFSVDNVKKTNFLITSYTVSIVPNTPIFKNDRIQITFPPEVSLPSQSQLECLQNIIDPSNYISSLQCNKISDSTILATFSTIKGSINSGQVFSFLVTNVQNAISTKPSSPFSNILISTSEGYLISQYIANDVTVTNNVSNIIDGAYLNQSNKQAKALSNYTITFTTPNPLPATTTITIQIPSIITISNSTANCYINLTGPIQVNNVCSISYNIITYNNAFLGVTGGTYTGKVVINFMAYNPDQNYNQSIIYRSFTDSSKLYRINKIENGLYPSLKCKYPCLQCADNNPDFCTSCYNQTGYPQVIQPFSRNGTTCVYQCSSGQTYNSTSYPQQCITCDQKCQTCAQNGLPLDPSVCLTCASSYPLFYQPRSTCLKTCNNTQYSCQGGQQCCDCKFPCQTCNGPTSCKTCFPNSNSPFQLNDQCLQNCPTGYTQIASQCVKCQSPCATCVLSQPSQCLTCDMKQGNQLLFGRQCVSQCPQGTTPQYSNITQSKCTGCVTGCLKCDSDDNSLCLLCDSGLSMLDNQCYKDCPFNYIKSTDGSTCEKRTYLLSQYLLMFPFASAAGGVFVVCFLAFVFTCGRSLIFSNTIAFLGILEVASLMYQIYSAYQLSTNYYIIMIASFGVYVALYAFNFFFIIYYCCRIQQNDMAFIKWRQKHCFITVLILLLSLVINFKLFRLLYSKFFCIPWFSAAVDNKQAFSKKVQVITLISIFLFSLPLIVVDSLILYYLSWGSQLYITCIETAGIALFSCVLTIMDNCCMCTRLSFFEELEARRKKKKDRQALRYKQLDQSKVLEPLVNAGPGEEEIKLEYQKRDVRERQDALKEILEHIKERNIGASFLMDAMDEDGSEEPDRESRLIVPLRRTNSAGELYREIAPQMRGVDDRVIKSYPGSPRANIYQEENKSMNGGDSIQVPWIKTNKGTKTRPSSQKMITKRPLTRKPDDKQGKTKTGKKTRGQTATLQPLNDDALKFDNVFTDVFIPPPEPEPVIPKTYQECDIQTEQTLPPTYNPQANQPKDESPRFKRSSIIDIQVENQKEADEEEYEFQSNNIRKKKNHKHRGKNSSSYYTEINEEDQEDQLSLGEDDTQREFLKTAYEEEDEEEDQEQNEDQEEIKDEEPLDMMLYDQRLQRYKRRNMDIGNTGGIARKHIQTKSKFSDKYASEKITKRSQDKSPTSASVIASSKSALKKSEKNSKSSSKSAQKSVGPMSNKSQSVGPKSNKTKSVGPTSNKSLSEKRNQRSVSNDRSNKEIAVQIEDNISESLQSRESRESAPEMTESQRKLEMLQNKVEKEFLNQRSFNIYDIMGEFKRNWRGKILKRKETLAQNNYRDLGGLAVNARGYLIDSEVGYIINRDNFNLMFRREHLTEEGEIPMPFKFECFNFKPHEILGHFDYDKDTLRPTLLKNKQGQLVDKHLRPVNMSGFLIDDNENIVDSQGRLRFVKEQLNFFGDIPLLYNYKGKQFDIRDIIGIFSRDQMSKQIILVPDQNDPNNFIDKLGRRVNLAGYLIDRMGNIVNKNQKIVFFRSQLMYNEPPKFFPFMKFDINSILGNVKRNISGEIMFSKVEKSQLGSLRHYDQDGRLVNESGYLANQNGDIVDTYGNLVFLKETLAMDKNKRPTLIQKVFKKGAFEKSLVQQSSQKYFKEPNVFDDNMLNQVELEKIVSQSANNRSISQKALSQIGSGQEHNQNSEDILPFTADDPPIVDIEINSGDQTSELRALSQILPLDEEIKEQTEGEDEGDQRLQHEQNFQVDYQKRQQRKKSAKIPRKVRQGEKVLKAYNVQRPISSYLPAKYEQRAKSQVRERQQMNQMQSVNEKNNFLSKQTSNVRDQLTRIPNSMSGMNQTTGFQSTTDIFRKNAISALGFTDDLNATVQMPNVKKNQYMAPMEQSDNSISAFLDNDEETTNQPQMYPPQQQQQQELSQAFFDDPSLQFQHTLKQRPQRERSALARAYDDEISKYIDGSDEEVGGIFDVSNMTQTRRGMSNPRPISNYKRKKQSYKMYEMGQRLDSGSSDSQISRKPQAILNYSRQQIKQQDSKLKNLEHIYLQGPPGKNMGKKSQSNAFSKGGFKNPQEKFDHVRDRFYQDDNSRREDQFNKYRPPSQNMAYQGYDI